MTSAYGSTQAIRRHNRPYVGLWYLKHQKCPMGGIRHTQTISFQLSHHKRYWASDPIFQSGDKLVILSVKESYRSPIPGRLGWEVQALDQNLNPFEFFWGDETAFRSVWER